MVNQHYGICEKNINQSLNRSDRGITYLQGSSYKVYLKDKNNSSSLTMEWCSDKIVILNNGIVQLFKSWERRFIIGGK